MLVLAATPIGNLRDASPRLLDTLESADIIAAEDTRTTGQLLKLLEVDFRGKLLALHDHNEHHKADEIADLARENTVVLVSDAGMPTVSDPGFRVVAAAVQKEVPVSSIPGPSAPVTALAVSGIATDRFCFEGFVPRKQHERQKFFASLAQERRTMLFFESPKRVHETLTIMAEHFGAERFAALCRELTKLHEEVIRGSLEDLIAATAGGVKGEIVLVVSGASPAVLSREDALNLVLARARAGERLKDVCRDVAQTSKASARELYDLATAAKQSGEER